MDIYTELKNDHEKVKQLLQRLEDASEINAETKEILNKIESELIPHARAEEEIFYNTISELNDDNSAVQHSYREHTEAELMLRTLRGLSSIGIDWKKATQKLKENLEHHIEEEETRIFDIAQELFSDDEAEILGDAFVKLKPKYAEQGAFKNSLDAVINMLPNRIGNALRKKSRSPVRPQDETGKEADRSAS